MTDRFAPDWSSVERMLNYLEEELSGSEHLIYEAFSAVSEYKSDSMSDTKRNLKAVVGTPGIPWILYDMIAELLKKLPKATRLSIVRSIRIETGRRYECLRVTPDGRWQVAWEINPNADDEEREVALEWYRSPDQDEAPIVPIPVVDYVGGCALLLRENLTLPAAGLLSIALESALWDALSSKGISRYSERVTYAAVKWELQRRSDKLIVTINGADKNLRELDAVVGEYPPIVTLELRRAQSGDTKTKVELKFDIDALLVDFFASGQIEKREQVADKGLTPAIQRARSEKVECLKHIAVALDSTLISLRNNLVHLPSPGDLHEPVPNPGKGELLTVEELKAASQFVRHLVVWVVDLINATYTRPLQIVEDENE